MEISSDSSSSGSDELLTSQNLRQRKNSKQKSIWKKLMDRKSSTSFPSRKSNRKSSKESRQTKGFYGQIISIPKKQNIENIPNDFDMSSLNSDSDSKSFVKSVKLRRKRKFNYFSWDSGDNIPDDKRNLSENQDEIPVLEHRRSLTRRSSIKHVKAHSTLLRDSDSHGSLHFSDISKIGEETSVISNKKKRDKIDQISPLEYRVDFKERPFLLNEKNPPEKIHFSSYSESSASIKKNKQMSDFENKENVIKSSKIVTPQKNSKDSISKERLTRLRSSPTPKKTLENTVETRSRSSSISSVSRKLSENINKTRRSTQLSSDTENIVKNTTKTRISKDFISTSKNIPEHRNKTRRSSQLYSKQTSQKQSQNSTDFATNSTKVSEYEITNTRSSKEFATTPKNISEYGIKTRRSRQLSSQPTPQKQPQNFSTTTNKLSENGIKARKSSQLSSQQISQSKPQSSNQLTNITTTISDKSNKLEQNAVVVLNRSLSIDQELTISLKRQKSIEKISEYVNQDDSLNVLLTPKKSEILIKKSNLLNSINNNKEEEKDDKIDGNIKENNRNKDEKTQSKKRISISPPKSLSKKRISSKSNVSLQKSENMEQSATSLQNNTNKDENLQSKKFSTSSSKTQNSSKSNVSFQSSKDKKLDRSQTKSQISNQLTNITTTISDKSNKLEQNAVVVLNRSLSIDQELTISLKRQKSIEKNFEYVSQDEKSLNGNKTPQRSEIIFKKRNLLNSINNNKEEEKDDKIDGNINKEVENSKTLKSQSHLNLSNNVDTDTNIKNEIKIRKTSYGGFKANLIFDTEKHSSLQNFQRLSSEVSNESNKSNRESNLPSHGINEERNNDELHQNSSEKTRNASKSNVSSENEEIKNSQNEKIDRAASLMDKTNKKIRKEQLPLLILEETQENNRIKDDKTQSKKRISISPPKSLSKKRILSKSNVSLQKSENMEQPATSLQNNTNKDENLQSKKFSTSSSKTQNSSKSNVSFQGSEDMEQPATSLQNNTNKDENLQSKKFSTSSSKTQNSSKSNVSFQGSDLQAEIVEIIKNKRTLHGTKIQNKKSIALLSENKNNQKSKNKPEDQIKSSGDKNSSTSSNGLNRTYFRTKHDSDTTESSDEEVFAKSTEVYETNDDSKNINVNNLSKMNPNVNLISQNNLNNENHHKSSSVHRKQLLNISNKKEIVISKPNNKILPGKTTAKTNLGFESLPVASLENSLKLNNEKQSESPGREKKITQLKILKFLEHTKKIKDKLDCELKEKGKNKFNSESINILNGNPPTKIRQRNKPVEKVQKDDDFKKVNGKIYKAPKIKLPLWISNQSNLQSKIFSVLSNNYEAKIANKKNQEIIKLMADIVKQTSSKKKNIDYKLINHLKLKLAQEKIISTTYEFHHFVLDHCPQDFIERVVPMKSYTKSNFDPPFDAKTLHDPIL